MTNFGRNFLRVLFAAMAVSAVGGRADATGVPIGGFLPLVGIGLTDEFDDDFNFFPTATSSPSGGTMLGPGGVPHYDVALLDTGAGFSILTAQAFLDFGLNSASPGEPDGYRGTVDLPIGGATGTLTARINDPFGLYAGGLQGRSGTAPFAMNNAALRGLTNTSTMTLPVESDLPNIVGLSFASQYATFIRSDQPQIFQTGGQTVRTPAVEFLALGSGGQGITRRAPLSLNPGTSFQQPPAYFPNVENFDLDNPQENPSIPTIVQGGLFLSVNAANDGSQINNASFFFDTGADVTVVSELNAVRLGFDPVLDEPDFTVAVIGSGGTKLEVPGFFADSFTIQAVGGSVTLSNVPIVVLDVTDPSNPSNIVEGIVGTNLLAGRNLVIDPNPSLGGGGASPSLYISDPVTTDANWSALAVSADWGFASSWSGAAVPGALTIANVRNMGGGSPRVAVVSSNATAWEVNISGTAADQTMGLTIQSGAKLTTFAGLNIEQHGRVTLTGGALDVQYVDIRGGRLSGNGSIATGSGPIPGQVENVSGMVAPGAGVGVLNIEGRFANAAGGLLEIEIIGPAAGTQYDQLLVDGAATLAGGLSVTLPGASPYVPALGSEFTILAATDGLGGTFDAWTLPELGPAKSWHIGYDETTVTLRVTIPGDFDGDFDVDGADLAMLQDGYGNLYTGADFLVWQRNLGMSVSPITAVPEPGGVALAVAAIFGAAARRERRG